MIDFSAGEEETAILDTVRKFVDREVMPFETILLRRAMEAPDSSPGLTADEMKDLQNKGRELGIWGISTPEAFGGCQLSYVLRTMIAMEFGRTFVNFRVGGSAPSILLHNTTDAQKREYTIPTIEGSRQGRAIAISEPGGGSDVRGMRTTAVRNGDDFIINGEKMWITWGNEVDFITVFARTVDAKGEEGITGFLVDRAMGWTSSLIPLMGSDDVAMLNFSDVRVPARNIIGEFNKGFELLIDWIYENRVVVVSAKNVGACERLISLARDWATVRKTFGKFLSERENIAFWIAESEIEARAAKLLTLHGAWRADTGKDYRHESYVAKVHSARAANQIVDRVLQIHGGMGYAMEMPIQRFYRDLRVQRIYEGSDEMNLASIARNIFKRNVEPGSVY